MCRKAGEDWAHRYSEGVLATVAHADKFAKEWVQSVTKGCEAVLSLLPPNLRVSAEDMTKVIFRSRSIIQQH